MGGRFGSWTCKWPFYRQTIHWCDVYIKTAPGQEVNDSTTMVYKMKTRLYGLAWSPVLWCDTIAAERLTFAFTPTQADPCVYSHGRGETLVLLTLTPYVEDMSITGKDEGVVVRLENALTDRFVMLTMGEVSLIFGMPVTRQYDGGTVSVTKRDKGGGERQVCQWRDRRVAVGHENRTSSGRTVLVPSVYYACGARFGEPRQYRTRSLFGVEKTIEGVVAYRVG